MISLRTRKLGSNVLTSLVLTAAALFAASAQADVKPYQGIPADQAETITSSEHLISTIKTGPPTAIWQVLEHAETVECLECIGYVAPLLYDGNARNREIAAWWLRRRSFGVFGPGEVYQQTLNVLSTDASPTRRANAACLDLLRKAGAIA